ncbi:MAG: hypothetical protein KC448_12830 [Yoonia sp.]|nr:hypothetical protein [Yoonia sp.]
MPNNVAKSITGAQLSLQDCREADQHAARLVRDEPALKSALDFGPYVAQGKGQYPAILIGDQSEIPLLSPPTPPVLDHRMALLGHDSDLVVLDRPDPDFCDYINSTLKKPGVSWLAAGSGAEPVARRCREDPKLRASLEAVVARAGGATLQSYLTSGNTWRLAQSLGEATRMCVHVNGPSPRIARRANDKIWFTALARSVLGSDAVPPTMSAYGPAAAAGLVRRVARQGNQIVIKVPDSAGSAGNIRLESEHVSRVPLAVIQKFLQRQLAALGWRGGYPLLVGVWDSDVTCSPSVQMWLPRPETGQPHADGIFEQRVSGLRAAFVGGARSTLPDHIQARLTHEALRIAAVLQRVGYYGRCSFDAVLVRDGNGGLRPHWIECNGRWGGVSIPMTAAKSLVGGTPPEGLVMVQTTDGDRRLSMLDLIRCLDPILYRPDASTEGMVIVAPPGRVTSELTLMAMAGSQDRAERLMEMALTRLSL